ncbi:response regulator [Aestuariivirga litoralis]|nr:response regulator [Aestuariivirga litoralis]
MGSKGLSPNFAASEGFALARKDIDILILDDDVDLLTSVAELLADCGYKVKGFSDPESAVEFAVDQTFAVGLFDFRLGSLKNGLDVIETLQAMGADATYVMVTADVERTTQLRAADLKIFEFMRKPVQPEELLDTINRAINHAKLIAA